MSTPKNLAPMRSMPILISARDARLVASACRNAALDADRQANRLHGSTAYGEFVAKAEKFYQLAAIFDRHVSARPAQRGSR